MQRILIVLFVCFLALTLVHSQKFTYVTTSERTLDYNYVYFREIQLISADLDTGIYFACAIDSVNSAGQITIGFSAKTGAITTADGGSQDPLYPPAWSTVNHWVVRGAPYSPCSYGGISSVNSGADQVMYAVFGFGDGGTTTTMSSPIPKLPNQDNMYASVVWSGNSLITIAWGGGSNLTSYLNNSLSLPGPFSYLAKDGTVNAVNKVIRYVNNDRFWVTLPIFAGYTLIYKCNMTYCEQTARIDGTIDFWLGANDNDEWWGCGKQLTAYFCTSSFNTSNFVYLPQSYADTNAPITTYHSTCLLDNTLILFLSPLSNNYTLLALDVQNNFTIVKETARVADTDWFAITCLGEAVVIPFWGGYDFWTYQQPRIAAPTNGPSTVVTPVSTTTPNAAPTAILSPKAEVITPVEPQPDVALVAGLTTSFVGAGVGVGIFLLVFLLKKKQKKSDPEDNNTNGSTTNTQNPVQTTSTATYEMVPSIQQASTAYVKMPANEEEGAFKSKMLIPYADLLFEKEIGAGSYGKVYMGKWRGASVAIKSNTRQSDTDAFLAEAKLTVALPPHPNVLLTYGVSIDSDLPYIVLEYCDGGSLDGIVFKQSMDHKQQRELVKGIAFGLYHLHTHNIVHRDLAVRNMLMHQGKPKIGDFGMSRVLKEEAQQGQTNSNVGPIRWMAPENIKSMTYSTKSDVWSFGVVISEIVTGHEPHNEANLIEVACKIRDEGFTPELPEDCDPVLRELMQMCWKFAPSDRPSMAEICDFVSKKL